MNKKTAISISLYFLLVSTLPLSGKEKPPWNDEYLKLDDVKIHYLEAGSGDRTLVLVPGWTMTAEIWKEQIAYFSSRGFRVLAIDPRSQGLSTKTEKGNTYQQQAADLHAFLHSLKSEHSYLVGWASGATALLEYVASPETLRPQKLVLVDCHPADLKVDDYPGRTTIDEARKLMLSFGDDRDKATEQYVRSLFKSPQPEWFISDLTKASLKTPTGAALTLYFDQFSGDRRSALSHIAVPTLIMTTTESRTIAEYIKAKVPSSTLAVIEAAGSAMFVEKPQTFNQTLESFFDKQ
jgi:non-heme chloroperoxidase